MNPEDVLTEEQIAEIKKKARNRTYTITRWVTAIVLLIVLCLAWYGAEMLIYGYSQPSVVKAFVAVCIAIGVSGRMKKELVWNDNKKEFIESFCKAIKDKKDDQRAG